MQMKKKNPNQNPNQNPNPKQNCETKSSLLKNPKDTHVRLWDFYSGWDLVTKSGFLYVRIKLAENFSCIIKKPSYKSTDPAVSLVLMLKSHM